LATILYREMVRMDDDTRLALEAFVARSAGEPAHALRMAARPLQGGLSAGAALISARYRDALGKNRRLAFVVKRLEGSAAREVSAYRQIAAAHAPRSSPALLGADPVGGDRWHLYLERIRPAHPWPWRDTAHARRVLERLAELHAAAPIPSLAGALDAWDYDAELGGAAQGTLQLAERFHAQLPRADRPAALPRSLPALRRLVSTLPALRRALLDFPLLGRAVIHGDVHPGNVMVRLRRRRHEPVLLDWGRARIGSPLEDVSSWLQSLGYWEPEARRRHDSLLTAYLVARGLPGVLTRDLRDAYWLAAASNVLSGALAYQLAVAGDPAVPTDTRAAALRAALDWLRVLRRADACWRA